MYREGTLRRPFGHKFTSFIRIIIYGCHVHQWKIKAAHVGKACPITSDHHVLRNAVSTFSDAPGNPVERHLG